MNPASGTSVSPQLFFETVNAFQRTEALKAAIELNLFQAIGEGNATAGAIAKRIEASERGTRILCDYMVVVGFLKKDGGKYALTEDTAMFLDRRSPAYLGSGIKFLLSESSRESFSNLAGAVRKGGTVRAEDTLGPEHPIWVEFARSMAPMMMMPAEAMAKALGVAGGGKMKVLSLAAGHGVYEATLARTNPQAEVWAVDWANVLEVAKETAARMGVSDRYHTIAGSAFDVDYGTGYDLALITNFLHHFDVPTNERLLRKVHAALKEGGRAAILEFVPNEDRVTPPAPAGFSLTMLAGTPSGDAYTFAELRSMLQNAGFKSAKSDPLPPTFFQLVTGTK